VTMKSIPFSFRIVSALIRYPEVSSTVNFDKRVAASVRTTGFSGTL